jgi:hypothetical protein
MKLYHLSRLSHQPAVCTACCSRTVRRLIVPELMKIEADSAVKSSWAMLHLFTSVKTSTLKAEDYLE